MKFNSKLWMLAVALATVGCQDDLGNDPNVGGGNAPTGENTFMKVTINSEVTTRAAGQTEGDVPQGGEGTGTEVGFDTEYDVNDVTVVLYYNEKDGTDGQKVKDDSEFRIGPNSILVGAGYASVAGTEASKEPEHGRQATVTVTISEEGVDFDNEKFGVIAVTNIGSETLKNLINAETSGITKGSELADYIQSYGSAGSFVMSSHFDTPETVTLIAGATEANAPEVDVHVERLAAKIRVSKDDAITNFLYAVKDDSQAGNPEVGKVRLDQVAVVNQLSSGSYLLKRVTDKVASTVTDGSIPDASDNYASVTWVTTPTLFNGADFYLQDEQNTGNAGTNYVIDPWTRDKDADAIKTSITATSSYTSHAAKTLSYINRYTAQESELGQGATVNSNSQVENSELWASLTGKQNLATSSVDWEKAEYKHIDLCYTGENTTSAANSLNGYSTGAFFAATYFPKSWSHVTTEGKLETEEIDYNGTEEGTGYDAITTTTAGKPFWTYAGNVYEDEVAIWAAYVQNPLEDNAALTYSSFLDKNIASTKKADFKNSALASQNDPFGYVAYLNEQLSEDDAEDATFGADVQGLETYVAQNLITIIKNSKSGAAVNKYDNGVNYYKYWIRHANNGDPTMGIMEFGIVRNNIYDLSVSEINGFGESDYEPTTPPGPDENPNVPFRVNLFVRNWVVRSNAGIML